MRKVAIATQTLHGKDATITVTLKADSGYMATETTRISAHQWGRIIHIMNEEPK